MKRVSNGFALALVVALCACSADDGPSGRSTLIGNYRLIVPADQATARKDFAGSSLRLSKDGMFNQQCRYKNGKTDSLVGTWSYSNGGVQFSAFKDCAGVWPRASGKPALRASLSVQFTSPTTILLSPELNVRYERH